MRPACQVPTDGVSVLLFRKPRTVCQPMVSKERRDHTLAAVPTRDIAGDHGAYLFGDEPCPSAQAQGAH